MSTKDTIGKYNLTEPKLYTNYAGWYLEEFEDTKGANQKPYIEEEQTRQWPREKAQKDKQRSTTYYTYKSKDRVTRTPLKPEVELR